MSTQLPISINIFFEQKHVFASFHIMWWSGKLA